MIEPIMYFGIGFLVAALVGLVVIPLVHGRAVRLTMRRLEAATPLSMAEIQADKDQLRAEFAMSTRRLEMSVEQLKTKTTSQLAELGKKGDAINRLKIELGEKTATIFALEARDKALRDQLRATEDEIAAKTGAMHDAERALSDKEAELAKLIGELDERSSFADAQKIEIVALKTQVEALKERLTDAGNERQGGGRPPRRRARRAQGGDPGTGRRARQGRKSRPPRRRARAATGGADHRSRNSRPPRPGSGKPARRAVARCSTESEFELKQLRAEIEAARKTESDLRAAIAETRRPRQLGDRTAQGGKGPAAGRTRPHQATSATGSRANSPASSARPRKPGRPSGWRTRCCASASTTSPPKWRGLPRRWKARIRRSTPSWPPKRCATAPASARCRPMARPNFSEAPSTNGDLADRIRALQTPRFARAARRQAELAARIRRPFARLA